MTDFIDDVMGFNPTDLNVFNAPEAKEFNKKRRQYISNWE